MPTFSLNAVPGLLGQITITENASGVPAQIGLNDTVLFLPGSQKVDVQASHQKDTNNKHLLTLIAVLQSAPNLIGGQISLTSLTLTLLFVADSTGTLVLDTTAAPVTAQGSARWTGASALGIQGGVDLTIRYVFRRDGPGGFVLALANTPVAMPGGFAEILQGEIGVEVLAGEAAFAVFARGQARFTQGGMGQVNQLLARVFPGQPAVQPLGFEVRQKFGLVNGAIPSSPSSFGPPLFTIDCNFGAGPAPALTNAPQPLRIDLGFPRFSLPLGGGGWSLHFPNTGIRFPDIPSLTPFSLSGILHLESGPVNQLSFQPAQSGEFSLSDPLRFLLDRLGWNGTRTPLDRVPSEASQSVGEFEWQDLFRNLMPDPIPSAGIDVAALAQQLGAAIQSALQNAGLEIERVFLTAFRGLETGGPAAFQAGWHNWFTADIGPADPVAKLPGLLLSLQSLGGAAWNDAMQALFSRNFSLPDFGREYVKSFAASSDLRFLDFLSTWERILANLSPAQIGSLAGGWMNAIVRLPELSPSRNFPPLPGMTLPRMATGEGLLTATFGQMIRTAAQGGSSRFSDWLTEIFGATKRSDRDEAQRAREAYQNAIDAAGKDAPELSLIQFLHLVVAILRKNAFPWWQLIANPPEARDPHTWRKLSAPGSGPPSAKRKYLIFSDVHRDREQDAHPVDPDNLRLFQSIAHFTKNKDLYLAALQYANSRKYTVIENGDCEELWFYTDIEELNREEVIDGQRYKGRPKLLKQILKTHPSIYTELRKLHQSGRYFRTYGNHDHFLRDPECVSLMNEVMTGSANTAFPIYDFLIIDGVKAMTEHTWLSKAGDIAKVIHDGQPIDSIVRDLPKGIVGMDSADYTDRCRMLIAHGHQWDFYNCDENNSIGQWIAGRVAVPADMLMDKVLAYRGLAYGGNPRVDFGEILSKLIVTSSWPTEQDAVRMAHQTQHMNNSDRQLLDSLLYKESFAAITGSFGISLNAEDGTTPETTRRNISGIKDRVDYLLKHHNHHLAIGHTHNPHSQPFFALHNAMSGLPMLGNLFSALTSLLPFKPNLFKSKYFNSGTCGWWDGVLWAIEIDEDGQARLVFWTRNNQINKPEVMDWELTAWNPSLARSVDQAIEDLRNFLRDGAVGMADEAERVLKQLTGYPAEILHIAVALGEDLAKSVSSSFEELAGGAKQVVETVAERIGALRADFTAFLLRLQSRALGFRTELKDTLSFEMSLSSAAADKIRQYRDLLSKPGDSADQAALALHAAVIAYPIADKFPRGLIPGSNNNYALFPERALADISSPMLAAFSTFLAMFPPQGKLAKVGDQAITTHLSLNDKTLKLTVTVETNPAAIPNPEPIV